MATIPLRQYNRDIENMIDRGQTDEAIAHCKYILQIFPKHIETYRLLGKAFLESQRYAEAADVFQRVVSSVPDDFVAQVGLSIIHEDEGNLDLAIWHMERAFEIQSSNSAVQEELRRLYGRRDGIVPARIRLTRGALVRMYARGNLFHQAISEILVALEVEPQRYDLKVLLARVYFLSGNIIEATEICSDLLRKYTYCYEANRILGEILPGTSRADEAEIYQQRIEALDPYIKYITSLVPSSAEVPDDQVSLESMPASQISSIERSKSIREDLLTSQELERKDQTGWNQPYADFPRSQDASFENDVETIDQDHPAPPFGLTARGTPPPVGSEERVENLGDQDLIPDWLKGAGWQVGSGTSEAQSTIYPGQDSDEEISAAEIPDWLRPLKPLASSSEDIGDSLEAGVPDTPEPDLPFQEVPDWLNQMVASPQESPEWMGEQQESSRSFLKPETDYSASPDWQISEDQVLEPLKTTEQPAGLDPDETQAWLESLATLHGSEAETLIARPEDRFKGPPTLVVEKYANIDHPVETSNLEPTLLSEPAKLASSEEGEISQNNITPENPPEAALVPIGDEVASTKQPNFISRWLRKLAGRESAAQSTAQEETVPEISEQVEFSTPSLTSLSLEQGENQDPGLEHVESVLESQAEEVSFDDEMDPPQSEEHSDALPEWLKQIVAVPSPIQADTQSEIEDLETSMHLGAELVDDEDDEHAEVEELLPQVQDDGIEIETILGFEESLAELMDTLAVSDEVETQADETSTADVPQQISRLLDTYEAISDVETHSPMEDVLPEQPIMQEIGEETSFAEVGSPETEAEQLSTFEVESHEPEASPPPDLLPAVIEPPVNVEAVSPQAEKTVQEDESEVLLLQSRSALEQGDFEAAINGYVQLIRNGKCLDQASLDLEFGLNIYPDEVSLWETIGDLYMQKNCLQQALDAYSKAEQLLN